MEYKNDCIVNDQFSESKTQEDDYEKELINWYSTYPVERKRKLNKRERLEKERKHLKELESTNVRYPHPVKYVDEKFVRNVGYCQIPKPYYKRQYREKISSYIKRLANRKVRHYKGELHNGYQHIHKVYDFWWQIS
jgi:hypothetical protein